MTEIGRKGPFESVHADSARQEVAPDHSKVSILSATSHASMIVARLNPGEISAAVRHRTVDELWFCLRGRGRMWRSWDGVEEVTRLVAGQSVNLPVGTAFQFRCDGDAPLEVLIATIPSWPGEGEAVSVEGRWMPTG